MPFDETADRNTRPFITAFGVDFLRDTDTTHFSGILDYQESVDQRPGVFRQVGNWTLTTQASVKLADGETVRQGTRRFRVQYSDSDERGLTEYILALA